MDIICVIMTDSHSEKSVSAPVTCKDCQYLMFSDCYGECRIGKRGIVQPDDYCGLGIKREKES